MEILAQRLLELRKSRGLKQEDVAMESGIAYRSYRRYESGEREPTASVLCKLADFYGVSTDYLLGRQTARPSEEGEPR